MGYIYKITNQINGKVYIGQTARSIATRWREHIRHGLNPNSREYNRHLYNSMRKYGIDSFSIELVEKCDNSLMSEREMFWIKFYNSSHPDYGYNLTLGGEGVVSIDYDEVYRRYDAGDSLCKIARDMNLSRSNLSQVLKEYENYDKQTIWERAMLEASVNKGTPVSQYDLDGNFINTFPSSKAASRCVPKTTHANIVKVCKNKNGLSGGFQWRFADDTPPGVYVNKRTSLPCPVCQINMDGTLLCIFQSMCEASRKTGVDQSSISKCCSHYKNYTSAGGYIWCYEKDYIERSQSI